MTGYLLISMIAGFIAFLMTYVAGASLGLMVFSYASVGGITFTFFAILVFVTEMIKRMVSDKNHGDYRATVEQIKQSKPLRIGNGLSPESTLKILAVDDDPLILELISMIAPTDAGFDVTSVISADAALKYLAKKNTKIDCFLLDINMPGMNGIELCRAIRAISGYGHTPVIMLSGVRDAFSMAEAFKAGATTYVTKPFDVEEFIMHLQFVYEIKLSRTADPGASDVPATLAQHLVPARKSSFTAPLPVQNFMVDINIVADYLSQLPPKIAQEIQVFGISFTQLKSHTRALPPLQMEAFNYNVTLAAKNCFDVEVFLIANFDSDSFVLVTTGVNLSQIRELEKNIERKLAQLNSLNSELSDLYFFTAIGGPLQPQPLLPNDAESRITRSVRMAQCRARGLAEAVVA
ncbi:response regulator [Loktanella sp. DJP18]|uniref:response regulator n=1 Tax=Loktanella sp. DJP18 TaxID=3409788 RepID=UPI003BB6B104